MIDPFCAFRLHLVVFSLFHFFWFSLTLCGLLIKGKLYAHTVKVRMRTSTETPKEFGIKYLDI